MSASRELLAHLEETLARVVELEGRVRELERAQEATAERVELLEGEANERQEADRAHAVDPYDRPRGPIL